MKKFSEHVEAETATTKKVGWGIALLGVAVEGLSFFVKDKKTKEALSETGFLLGASGLITNVVAEPIIKSGAKSLLEEGLLEPDDPLTPLVPAGLQKPRTA